MPLVIVSLRPKGFPMAATGSPTVSALEFPSTTGCNVVAPELTLMTARSLYGSSPTLLALVTFPSKNVTCMVVASSIT